MKKKKVIIVGGGAAGFFCAANLIHPNLDVTIVEKTNKLLSKVKISGGGRCNVTNGRYESIPEFATQYPRGKNILKKTLHHFSFRDTISWFEKRGVKLKIEEDGRMFPITDESDTIINCLLHECKKNKVTIITQCTITQIRNENDLFYLHTKEGKILEANFVCIAIGGSPQEQHYKILSQNIQIEKPLPSLFTFNLPGHPIRKLMGVSIPNTQIKIQGTKLQSEGPTLITHWGLSGPAVLKLSAWAAKELAAMNWNFKISVNWWGSESEESIRKKIEEDCILSKNKTLKNAPFLLHFPSRFREFLLEIIEIHPDIKLGDLGKKHINKLAHNLFQFEFEVKGKTTFKEEFVTAGGFSTQEIHTNSFESKKIQGLYIIGECLNIDGITGGFNFQNAWTSGFLAAKSILKQL